MPDVTRYARVQNSVAPLRTDGVTQISRFTAAQASPEVLFRERQRMMASALREERRPGLFVFAAHRQFGHVARLWLEATPAPRAGLIGRHEGVDLKLPLDDAISLRHVMFVVRRKHDEVHFVALDLQSNNGLQLESGAPLRLAEAAGPLILCASDFVFFCFPTGGAVPWDCESPESWGTLGARRASRVEPRERAGPGQPAGRLELATAFGVRSEPVGEASLRRGLLVGRADRCEQVVPVNSVSRVHVVLLSLEGEPWVIDAGSTNGTWHIDREVRIARLRDGEVLMLGSEVTLCWRGSH